MIKPLLTLFLTLFIFLPTKAQDGSLDNSFGTNGKVVTDIFGLGDEAHDIAIQDDGKIIVAGSCRTSVGEYDFCAVRYHIDGSVDTTFGTNGIANINFTTFSNGTTTSDEGQRVFILSNNKIIITGWSRNRNNSDDFFAAIRLNSDGSLDTTYGNNGRSVFDFGGSNSGNPADATLLPNEHVAISGYAGSPRDFATGLLDVNGVLDQNFSIDGKQTTDAGGSFDEVYAVISDDSGNIYVAGEGDNDFTIIKYNSSGRLDTSFNGTGIASTTISGGEIGIRSLKLLPNGQLIAAGVIFSSTTDRDIILLKYNTDGSLDTSFGTNGWSRLDIDAGSEDIATSMLVQNDGKIVVCGSLVTGGDFYFFTARFDPTGQLDPSYSGNGLRIETFGSGFNIPYAIAQQADGKLIVAGYVGFSSGNTSNFAIARYNNTDTLSSPTNSHEAGVALYPNPATSTLNISSRTIIDHIALVDSSGRSIDISSYINHTTDYLKNIDTSALSAGIYVITLSTKESTESLKIIKK